MASTDKGLEEIPEGMQPLNAQLRNTSAARTPPSRLPVHV